MDLPVFVSVFSKFFFILTPFFCYCRISFTITDEENTETKHALAIRVTVGVLLISAILFIFGQEIFKLLGISVDAFRIGAGALLFLSAISLVDGKIQVPDAKKSILDLAVVPLAIPITLGPGSVGTLIVMGGEIQGIGSKLLTLTAYKSLLSVRRSPAVHERSSETCSWSERYSNA